MNSIYQFKDFIWQYLMPYICLLGFIFNIINIIVFSSKNLKNPIYKYFMCHSVFECIYALLSFAHYFTKHVIKVPSCSIIVNFIEFYFINLVTTSIAIFLILIEILIALNRLKAIFYLKCRSKLDFKPTLIIILLTLSILSQYPVFKSRSIELQSNSSSSNSTDFCSENKSYTIHSNEFVMSKAYKLTYSAISYFRGLVAPLILLTINIIICVNLKTQMRKKITLKQFKKGSYFILINYFIFLF